MFTQAQIIAEARARMGNSVSVSVSEEFVKDAAIAAEMRENVNECARIFGASSSRKEVEWVGIQNPPLTAPATVTATTSGSGSSLAAGTYSYIVTAMQDMDETAVSATATVANAGGANNVVSWSAVQYATGYRVYSGVPGFRLVANMAAGTTTWTDNGTATLGGGPPIQNSTGKWVQDFPINAMLGTDVLSVVEVVRSDAYRDTNSMIYPGGYMDGIACITTTPANFIDQGLQEVAFQTAQAQARYDEQVHYRHELVCRNGQQYLRVFPKPRHEVQFLATYISVAGNIESLPDNARDAMGNAACRAIMDCIINRVKSEPNGISQETSLERRAFMETIIKQRDYYAARYRRTVQMGRTPGI